MRALVVYDSKFGNTRAIAEKIGEGLEDGAEVDVRSTIDAGSLFQGVDLLVVGGPTQAHGVEATMREFLEQVPIASLDHVPVAVFDTRVRWPKLLSGSAADGIAKRLVRGGAELIDEPESFFVEDKEGPLRDGELKRAADWGRHLLAEMETHA